MSFYPMLLRRQQQGMPQPMHRSRQLHHQVGRQLYTNIAVLPGWLSTV